MSSFEEAYERIKFATSTKTQVEIAEVLEIRQSSISDAKRRNSVPGDWYMKLFEKFGLNPDWLKRGVGPMFLRTEAGYLPQEMPTSGLAEAAALYGEPAAKSVVLTVSGTSCQFQDGDIHPTLPQLGKVSLPLSYADAGIQVIKQESRNMEPTILRDAYVGVNTSVKVPTSGMLYALFWPHEGLVIRRVFLDSDDVHYTLRSDMPEYAESTLSAKLLQERIFGRVAWVLQNL